MKSIVRFAVLAVALLAASCATSAPQRDAARETLIVISLDGFRADYLDRGLSPTLSALAADGVRSTGMRPSFPSVTMPNHYTLMTGLRPDHHGIIDNTMVDPAIPGWFGGPDPRVVRDPRWWQGATPLWVSAENQGVRTAAMQWPGSNIEIRGRLPGLYQDYDPAMGAEQRVDAVLGWLDRPPAERPRFVAMYFGMVDDAGHVYGPDSPQVNAAIGRADAAVARLVEGLRARNLSSSTNIVVVADHGMTGVDTTNRLILIDQFVDVTKLNAVAFGAYIGVNPTPGNEAEVESAMLAPHPHMTCWRKAEIPAHLHYGTNARVPAIFCLAEPGWLILTQAIGEYAQVAYPNGFRGNHGYDPAVPDMAALFIAHGPAFRRGVTLGAFDNTSVYPMLARVLGVTPEANDGNLADLAPALAE